MKKNKIIIIGYSGHSYVCIDNARLNNYEVIGYCDSEEKIINPFQIKFLGDETTIFDKENKYHTFIGIGDNVIREKIYTNIKTNYINLFHPKSIIAIDTKITLDSNIIINAGATVNPLTYIEEGVIVNTNAIIEHECYLSSFCHVAPGVVWAGNVKIGKRSFIGANSVVKQGISIGKDVTIGAGSVIINNVPDNATVVGNPGKIIKIKKI